MHRRVGYQPLSLAHGCIPFAARRFCGGHSLDSAIDAVMEHGAGMHALTTAYYEDRREALRAAWTERFDRHGDLCAVGGGRSVDAGG
jgi:hypothetical protein